MGGAGVRELVALWGGGFLEELDERLSSEGLERWSFERRGGGRKRRRG